MENTAKNFALQLGSLITLYISIGALIGLLFGIITVQYPDEMNAYWEYENATSSIRFTIAMLIVFFPAYLVLTRAVNVIRRTESGTYLTLTKWLIYLSLLIGGGVLLGDLVAVLNGFLEGELTIRFVLKALTVLLVIGTAFTYYLFDVRGHWQSNEKHSLLYAGVVGVAVLVALGGGFMHTETPSEVRAINIDERQITDLQNIQYQVESYAVLNGTLPKSISEAFNGLNFPATPEGRMPYTYTVTGTNEFSLCAEFAFETPASEIGYGDVSIVEPLTIKNPNDWRHGKGEWCFTRVLNSPK